MTSSDTEVAVIGAGPYGLATAAHLRAAGHEVRVFGEPMGYWEASMPAGMLLRSPWRASVISSPAGRHSLAAYEHAVGGPLPRPIPRDDFVAYGRWFARHAVGDVQARRISGVELGARGLEVEDEHGDVLTARRVVLATGLAGFEHVPAPFDALPSESVSHTSAEPDLSRFAGRRVLVVGRGQSATESAALAKEAGAEVELLAAGPVHWLVRSARLHAAPGPLGSLLYAPHDVGPAGLSWVVATPGAVRRLPAQVRGRLSVRSIRPAASAWLVNRLRDVPVTNGIAVAATPRDADGVRVQLADRRELAADHVLLGTGFRPHLDRLAILRPRLRSRIRSVGGYPLLGPGMEASVPGLHVLGALSSYSFGPVMRFVAGTWYTAPAVAQVVSGRGRRVPGIRRQLGAGAPARALR